MLISGIKRISRTWQRIASGLLLPIGHSSSRSTSSSETYLQMKGKALEVEALYAEAGIPIPKGSGLAVLIQSAKDLSDGWLLGGASKVPNDVLWNAAHLSRVADACLVLRGDSQAQYMRRLASGSLDLLRRDRTEAKDILWELELLHVMRVRGMDAQLKEPPDIVAQFAGANLGIACKKLYSENNVEKVLSNGVAQIEEEYEYGVVAVNLDDLLPPEKILVQEDHEGVARALNQINLDFMNRHERHLRKYLGTGRILSAFVSTGVLADIRGGDTRLHNARQSTGWMIPGLPEDKQRVFRSFYEALMQ